MDPHHAGLSSHGCDRKASGPVVDAETGFQYLRARYYDPATGQFLSRDPITAQTRSPYAYTYGNPLNWRDPTGLDIFDDVSDVASDVGDFVVRNRHTIIDVGTTLGAATLTGACIASVACGVVAGGVGLAAVGLTGVSAHIGSDRAFNDDNQISVGEAFFRSGFSTASGAGCAVLFAQGCFGSAAFPAGTGMFGSQIGMLGLSRALPGLFLADLFIMKQGLLSLFDKC